jgi:ABC-type uncharacterized transport system auxiliary subunit
MKAAMRAAVFLVVGLAGCMSAPPIPDESFYRLPTPEVSRGRPVNAVVAVDEFRSDGLHGERALVYSTDSKHIALRQYRYDFWEDPPPRLLRDYLVAYLRTADVARVVTGYDPSAPADYVISGKIWRFEQLIDGDRSQVTVSLEIQVDRNGGGGRPLLLREYRAVASAATPAPKDAAAAFEQALSQVASQFVGDLREVLRSSKPPSRAAD